MRDRDDEGVFVDCSKALKVGNMGNWELFGSAEGRLGPTKAVSDAGVRVPAAEAHNGKLPKLRPTIVLDTTPFILSYQRTVSQISWTSVRTAIQ